MSKKVVNICRLYNPHIGGVERHVYGLNRELVRRGYRVTVITEQYDPQLKLVEKQIGGTIRRIPYPLLKSKWGVWKWMRTQESIFIKADIIQIHDVFWWYLPSRIRQPKQPVFTTFHGYETDPPRQSAKWQRQMIRSLSGKTMGVGQYIEKWYGTKLDLLTYGAANFKPAPLPSTKNLVYLGRLEKDTGIRPYLDLVRLGRDKIFLDIYGQGEMEAELRQKIKDDRLPAAVHKPTQQPAKMIRQARHVLAAQYLAILEAMQTKRLVLALYTTPMKRDYLLCHPQAKQMVIGQNAKEISDQLSRLSKQAEMSMIKTAHAWARQQTFEKLTNEYERLWGVW